MHVTGDGETGSKATWVEVGSVKPDESSDPIWVRSKAIALALRTILAAALQKHAATHFADPQHTGLIISFEAPTPGEDRLATISRFLHAVLLEQGSPIDLFARVHVQLTNAATLRRLMGLVQRGAGNKKENIAKAFTFLPEQFRVNIDSDSCDAVLMAMMARYTAAILMGFPETVPEGFRIALCDATIEVVGKGNHAHTRTKGILHRPEYWSEYTRQDYTVLLRDAREKKSRLDKFVFTI